MRSMLVLAILSLTGCATFETPTQDHIYAQQVVAEIKANAEAQQAARNKPICTTTGRCKSVAEYDAENNAALSRAEFELMQAIKNQR